MVTNISSLPDYAALKKFASALWQQDSSYHGAAVMVGAGFSRCAASTGDATRKLPLWNDFSKTLAGELQSGSTDPLRLAEEYCAYFGQQALYDLIKKEVNDVSWNPGALHRELLELPWSEVLTTNWDTLIERASIEVHHPVYSVVSKQEDLSCARSPRIVKLHGTIDVTKDLIFTQEDYRKYPQQHAAFVNFSRQAFIENELCLLGFSGDDPNFLQWTGWVRDHLANHSRRIYLVGALELNSAKRKYLESINVAPIDLGDLVADFDDKDIRHLEATNIFFKALRDLKPKQTWEWYPTSLRRETETGVDSKRIYKEPDYAAKLLEEQLPSLEKDRLSYPGWLIVPNYQRDKLRHQISEPLPSEKNLSAMTANCKAKLLYEISWHYQVTFEAVPPWLAKELLTMCDTEQTCTLTKKQQLEIALLLLKNTRWMSPSEAESISQTTNALLEKGEKYWAESVNELAYHNAIVARDRFDYATLEQCVEKITNSNPTWKLRKASLLAELGHFDKGERLVTEAYKELLLQYRNDRNSIHVLSRLAWAHRLMRGIDPSSFNEEFKVFPFSYRDSQCDPWDHIEHIRDKISKALNEQQKQQAIEPLFEPGRYKNNGYTINFRNELHPLFLLEGVSNTVGMPLRWDYVGFLVEQASRLAELEDIDNIHRFALAIRAANSGTSDILNKVFSRVQIACLPEDDIIFLLSQCKQAINYWTVKLTEKSESYAIERLGIFIEVLARVSVRATPEQAMELFRMAVSLGKKPEFHHFWLFDSIKHLIEFALKSIPELQQQDILVDALSFPLQVELTIKERTRWVNPVIRNPGERKKNPVLDRRVDEIIDCIAPCSTQSAPALIRLFPLIKNSFLTAKELDKIIEKVWGDNIGQQTIPETGLLHHVLLELPSQNPSSVKALVRSYLFDATESKLLNMDLLLDIVNAALAEDVKEFPSEEQAIKYFEQLVAWRPQRNDSDRLNFAKQDNEQTADLIGAVLARSVVPSLYSSALTEENFKKLFAFYTEVETSQVLIAFSYFAAANEIFIGRVEKLIRQGFQSEDVDKLAYAAYTLLEWRNLKASPAIDKLILRLVYLIGSNRIVGLPALLWTANQMYCREYLSPDNIEVLTEILPVIFDSAGYCNISPSSRESVSISFVRAACVKLARDILNKSKNDDIELNRILAEAKLDALPEVRFAESEMF